MGKAFGTIVGATFFAIEDLLLAPLRGLSPDKIVTVRTILSLPLCYYGFQYESANSAPWLLPIAAREEHRWPVKDQPGDPATLMRARSLARPGRPISGAPLLESPPPRRTAERTRGLRPHVGYLPACSQTPRISRR